MPTFIDLRGRQFGRLIVLKEAGRAQSGDVLWLCHCSCGNQSRVRSTHLRGSRGSRILSCGCLRTELLAEHTGKLNRVHGHYSRKEESPTHHSWRSMRARCMNPNAKSYPRYGGAGVKVAPAWMTFAGFLASMGERPPNTTLGRLLDTGNYEPGNAFWQTTTDQKLAQKNKKALLAFATAA